MSLFFPNAEFNDENGIKDLDFKWPPRRSDLRLRKPISRLLLLSKKANNKIGRAQRLLNELKSSVEVLKSHQDLGELTTTLMNLIKETPEELENNRLIISNTELLINSIGGICSDLNFKS